MIISFTNVIGAIRNAFSVVRSGLKMWLGFQTSETLGREEVVNGDFATDSDWTKENGWSIANGLATRTNVGSYTALQQNVLESGKVYQVTFTIDSVTSGEIFGIRLGTNYILSNKSTEETFTGVGVANATTLSIMGNPTFAGSISNISIKELTQITPDKSGNNNVGELFTGKALELDGVNDEINFGASQIPIKTISFWIKPLSVSNEGLFYLGLSGFPQFRQISITSGNISATSYLTNFTPYVNNIQTSAVTQDVWQRVVLTFDEWTTTSLQIGKVYSSVYGHFAISDVQFYNETWSTDDIAYDYANPNKLAIDNPNTSLSVTNLKAYWALSEGDGLVAYDSGTNLEEELNDLTWIGFGDWSTDGDIASNNGGGGTFTNDILELGKTYQFKCKLSSYTSGEFSLFLGRDSQSSNFNGTDEFTFTSVCTFDTAARVKSNNGIGSLSISSLSIKEVTASDHGGILNGATYVDAQPRIPQLGMMNWSKGSNLFSYSQDFSLWNKEATVTLTPNYGTSPSGANDSTRIQMDANDSLYLSNAGSSKTFSIYVKGTQGETIRLSNGVTALFTLTGDWDRIQLYDTSGASVLYSFNTYSGATARDMEIWGGQLEDSSSASAYRLTDGAATLNSTVIPNPTIPTQDIFGNAVRDRLNSFNLDGSGYATNETLPTISGNISLSFWVKLDTFVSGNLGQILGKREGSSWLRVYRPYASHLRLEVAAGQQYTFSVTENQWVYVAITINSSNQVSVYVDDSAASGATLNTSFSFINTEVFTVGAWLNPVLQPTSELNGLVSDVLIYDRVLTSDEVENNYNAGLSAHTN